jgi:hypothetical protein
MRVAAWFENPKGWFSRLATVTSDAHGLTPLPPMNEDAFNPFSLESRLVNIVAPLAVVGLALAVNLISVAFFIQGIHVWMHEMGHAAVAWLTGRKAFPVPLGWTSVGNERSLFV